MDKQDAEKIVELSMAEEDKKRQLIEQIRAGNINLFNSIKNEKGPVYLDNSGVYICDRVETGLCLSFQLERDSCLIAKEIEIGGSLLSGLIISPALTNISLIANEVGCLGILNNAEKCSVTSKRVIIRSDALKGSKDSSLIAKRIDVIGSVMDNAESCSMSGDEITVHSHGIMNGAKKSILRGENLVIEGPSLYCAKDCAIIADRISKLKEIKECENCYIFSDKIDSVISDRGFGGGAIVSEDATIESIGRSTVIVKRNNVKYTEDATIKYIGNFWKGFRKHVEEARSRGKLEALRAFKVERATLASEQEFDEAVDELDKVWREVQENFWKYRGLAEKIELPDIYDSKNSERTRFLRNLPKEVQNVLKEKYELTDDNAKIVYRLNNLEGFIDAIDTGFEAKLKRSQGKKVGINKFVETFSDQKKVEDAHADLMRDNGLAPAYRTFNGNYSIALSQSSAEADESANELLYKQGLEIIEGIRSGSIQLSPQIDESKYESIRKDMKQKMKDSKGKDETAKAELEKIKKEIKEETERKAREAKDRLKPQYSVDELKEELSQLSQHYLSGKPADKARKISDSIVVREGKLTSSTMDVSVWDKSLQTMPTYEEYGCCAFLGYGRSDILDYMQRPDIQLISAKVGDKNSMIIAVVGKDSSGRKVLVVDSVESRSHMFARKDVSTALAKAIEDYARESGFDRVFYNATPGNSAPKEFVQSVYGLGKRTGENVSLPKVYLEQKGEFLEIPLAK